MTSQYGSIIDTLIAFEIAGKGYIYNDNDQTVLNELLNEINTHIGTNYTNYHYFSELYMSNQLGIGNIVMKFIRKFSNISTRARLFKFLVSDKIIGSFHLFLDEYKEFKNSNRYVIFDVFPNTGLCEYFDDAFKQTVTKRTADELFHVISTPLDAFYLPQTVQKLASYKLPEMEDFLWCLLKEEYPEMRDLFHIEDELKYNRDLEVVKEGLKRIAVLSLRYYPSKEIYNEIHSLCNRPNVDRYGYDEVRHAAKKTLRYLEKRMN